MNIHYDTGRLRFEFSAETIKDAWKKLAIISDVFETDRRCGSCESDAIGFRYRKTQDGYDYFCLVCNSCGHQLDFGQTREGGRLFPKRRNKEGDTIGDNGWYDWRARAKERQDESGGGRRDDRPEERQLTEADIPF